MDKQKDFEKGWEEYKAKRKQEIEEMANDIKASLGLHFGKTILYPYIAQDLYACGYRKIPENAVVFTREEYNKLCQKIGNLQYDKDILKQLEEENIDLKYDKFELKNEISEKDNKIALLEETIECIKFNVDFTRKETAERFAERAKEKLGEFFDDNEDNDGKISKGICLIEVMGVVAKDGEVISLGLIDEICKEFEED